MLMNNLSILVRQMRVFSERKLLKLNIGFPEQVILMVLSLNDNVNQEYLSNYFNIDKGTIAKTVAKLEEKSLITKLKNSGNKRENIISLSSNGQKIIEDMRNVLEEWNNKIYEDVNENEKILFEKVLKKMTENSKKLFKN